MMQSINPVVHEPDEPLMWLVHLGNGTFRFDSEYQYNATPIYDKFIPEAARLLGFEQARTMAMALIEIELRDFPIDECLKAIGAMRSTPKKWLCLSE